jgi:hypothetical protein
MDPGEIGRGDSICLAQDRDKWRVFVKVSGSIKFWEVPVWLHNW